MSLTRSLSEGGDHGYTSKLNIFRSKGFFWLASRPKFMLEWSQTGGSYHMDEASLWWADIPKDEWPESGDDYEAIMTDWKEPFGDRRCVGNSFEAHRRDVQSLQTRARVYWLEFD
jgi:G3E family GTPase